MMKEHIYEVEVIYRDKDGKQDRVRDYYRADRASTAQSKALFNVKNMRNVSSARLGSLRDCGNVDD